MLKLPDRLPIHGDPNELELILTCNAPSTDLKRAQMLASGSGLIMATASAIKLKTCMGNMFWLVACSQSAAALLNVFKKLHSCLY